MALQTASTSNGLPKIGWPTDSRSAFKPFGNNPRRKRVSFAPQSSLCRKVALGPWQRAGRAAREQPRFAIRESARVGVLAAIPKLEKLTVVHPVRAHIVGNEITKVEAATVAVAAVATHGIVDLASEQLVSFVRAKLSDADTLAVFLMVAIYDAFVGLNVPGGRPTLRGGSMSSPSLSNDFTANARDASSSFSSGWSRTPFFVLIIGPSRSMAAAHSSARSIANKDCGQRILLLTEHRQCNIPIEWLARASYRICRGLQAVVCRCLAMAEA